MIRGILALALVALAAAASAQTPAVDAARAAGIIGERYDGFIGIASPVSAQIRSQVATLNIRRRSLYSSLASRKGASPQEVGITAGCQLLARVQVGQSYLLSDGVWRRREPGQGAPVPAYCR
ncbi:MAG TPA: YdbL family protein [Sphingomicrobium sp.]